MSSSERANNALPTEDPPQHFAIECTLRVIVAEDDQFRVRSLLENTIGRLSVYDTSGGVESRLSVVPAVNPHLQQADLEVFLEYQRSQATLQRYHESLNLSDRERQVMDLISQGLDHGKIAKKLRISRNTVKSHQDRIGTKMGTGDRMLMAALYTGQIAAE